MKTTLPPRPPTLNWAYPLGFWSALATTLGGVVYFLAIATALLTGRFTFPPPESLQLFGGISSLLFCPVLVVLFACLHTVTPQEKNVFSQVSLGFCLLFALSVSINRFTQLGVVRQSMATGNLQGLDWFLPYGERSLMLGLEMMGWGWFLGLAFLFAALFLSTYGYAGCLSCTLSWGSPVLLPISWQARYQPLVLLHGDWSCS